MSTPSHDANNSSETNTDKRQTRDPSQRETDIASQPYLSKIAGIGAGLARFALNKPVTIGMLFLSMLLFGIVSGRLLPLEKFPGIDIPEMIWIVRSIEVSLFQETEESRFPIFPKHQNHTQM